MPEPDAQAVSAAPTRRRGGDPALTVDCRHMSEAVEVVVRDWFAGRLTDFETTGERSVYLPVAADGHPRIKIKGAGRNGRAIRFGRRLKRGPVAPLFDYDGRRMEDVALSHAGACVGGASMQQAVTEWRVTRHLQSLGRRTVPCLGYGSVSDGTRRSWFSVFGWDDAWLDTLRPPAGTPDEFVALAREAGETALDLARRHRLVGFFWLIRDGAGGTLLKDLHPFRRLDPINASQISWVMQVGYALHITAINSRLLCEAYFGEDAPADAPVEVFRPIRSDLTLEDWDRFRFSIVAPWMIERPRPFSPEALAELLAADPIASGLMALCPPEFERSC
jgi:hypothetical protein